MRYVQRLYRDNPVYTVHKYENREQWLKGRVAGIGGSDASAAIGMNPWKSNLDLWMQKTNRKEALDISDNPRVQYGQNAEEGIRQLYQAKKRGIMSVNYMADVVLSNNEYPQLLYSPDGLLEENDTGRKGILEIKTTTIARSMDREKWDHRIPDNYYIQVLHGLNVTGFDFVELIAELTYNEEFSQIRIYHIEREQAEEDLKMIKEGVLQFWDDVMNDREPALALPTI